MPTRRTVLKAAGGGVGLWFVASVGGRSYAVEAPLHPAALDVLPGRAIRTWAAPLLIPPAMPVAGTLRLRGGKNADVYDIALRQHAQQILPPELPVTPVWGYGPATAVGKRAAVVFHAPSATIEARHGRPVRIRWRNELVDPDTGTYLPHLLPVDPTLHWANPAGGAYGRDSRPHFDVTPPPYDGPVPAVTHVHGAAGVGDESDGYPEAWYLPANAGVPAGYADVGTWYSYFRAKAEATFGAVWAPGSATSLYPNAQRAGTLWYHDHTLGMTRANVYAGPAGFYIIRGGPEGDDAVLDTRTGLPAVLPGPAPRDGDGFPARKTYYEIPLAIQDRTFTNGGALFYPDTREFFDGTAGPYVPHGDVAPIWNPEFFGNAIMVNGRTWPFHTFEQRRYRLRLLNGCNSRFLILDFSGIPGAQVAQIGTEGGFLAAPVDLVATTGSRLLLAPAERADVVLDLAAVPVGSYVLTNVGPDEPFGGGTPGEDFDEADPLSTGLVLRLDVVPAQAPDTSTPAQFLQLPAIAPLVPTTTRSLALVEEMSMAPELQEDPPPVAALLATVTAGSWTTRTWADHVTENPAVGATETWEIFNATADAHPIHVHETLFQVVDRQPVEIDHDAASVAAVGAPRPPEPNEVGWKDTVTAYPGEVTRLRMTFDRPGQYVWHCHIVEHEDNEMMRPFRIGPVDPAAPVQSGGHT